MKVRTPKRRTIFLPGIAGLFIILTAFTFTGPADGEGYKVGDVAADFNLQNAVDDNWVSLQSLGEVSGYIVVFTCNTCPYAKMYEDRLISLHRKYAAQGYPVVAINPNDPGVQPGDSFAEMKKRAKAKGFPFKYLFDAEQKIYPQYGATRTPHIFLLDQNRVVRYIGAIDNNAQNAGAATEHYVEAAIEALKRGEDPNPGVTKAIGCTIKVRS